MKANMKKILISFTSVALSFMLATPVFAQANTDMTTTILQGLQNFNGTGAGKAAAPAAQSPSLDELKASILTKAGMKAVDADRNGTVSKAELAAITNKLFDIADTNRDGQLSEQELSTFAANMTKILSLLR